MQIVLQERADVWWASLLCIRFEDGAIDVAWDEFVRLFRAKFVPEHIQDRMEQEFLSLTQGSMTVLEYEARFAELSKYAPHIVTDERRKAKKFVMGLKPSLRTRLVAFDHRTLDEALSAACRQEGEMQQYLEEKKASQKRPAAMFQRQDKKKVFYMFHHVGTNAQSQALSKQVKKITKKQKQGYLSTDTKDLSTDLTGVVCQKTHSSESLHLSTDDRSAVNRSHSPEHPDFCCLHKRAHLSTDGLRLSTDLTELKIHTSVLLSPVDRWPRPVDRRSTIQITESF
ncbi:hypothetical protein Taro_040986 [Colocasia esculenta]|uniref:Retrotransposon gag domain-containing protein n=1 Tax=Colocasia esculenta TaxID=4460 RepID=A0A843WAB5_COLES|nr:hypothetical protein [Colocasia esculenta]